MISDLTDFFKERTSDRSIISFIGNVTPVTIDSMMNQIEERMEELNEDSKVRKKLFNIFLESLQNLYHHSDKLTDVEKMPSAICIVDKSDSGYSILTGNYIKNEKVDTFKGQLNKINEYTKEELKEYYLQVLNNGQRSSKDGAGLGMIEIARKTDDRLDFEFVPLENGNPLNDNHSLFVLNIKVFKKSEL